MAGFEHAFQAIDETISDCCLRELPWEFSSNLWKSSHVNNTRERIVEVYRIGRPLILKILKMDKSPLKNKKKLSICKSMMSAGQEKMETKCPYEALNAYNKAVVFAPHQEDHLSRAVSDRAACLLEIGDPALALRDIEAALAIDSYPFEKLFELEERRGHSFLGMKQYDNARTSFNKAILLLEDAAGFLHKRFVERKMHELQKNLQSCMQFRDNNMKEPSKFLGTKTLPELKGGNSTYPALSNKVNVTNGHKKGQELFAANDIGAGEIIGVEKPLVSFLEKDYVKTNCWNCLVTLKAPYGCPLCSAVKFCSKACLEQALSTYHPSECLLTDLLLSNNIASWNLAFRAVSSKPLKNHLANKGLVNNNGIHKSEDINSLLNLTFPTSNLSEEDVKRKTVMSVFYLILLQMTGYFDSKENLKLNPSLSSIYQMKGEENDNSLSENELYIATLLDRIIDVTPFCTTEVCHFEMTGGDWTTGKVTPVIGKTINPTLALVTHSCYPTAARVCYENKTLLISQKNIRPGEGITINYSAPFYAANRLDRKQYLYSGYVLNCECEACRKDWPLFENLPTGPPGLLDQDIPNGGDITGSRPLTDISSQLNSCHLSKTEQNVIDVFHRVKGKIDQLEKVKDTSCPPSKIMIQNQVRLFRCLLAMYSSKLYKIKTGYSTLPIPV